MCLLSGDQHANPIASLSNVNALGSPPSTGTIQRFVVPLFFELNTICFPSGESREKVISWLTSKSLLSRPLLRLTAHIALRPSRRERNANCSPSGNQLGRSSLSVFDVT